MEKKNVSNLTPQLDYPKLSQTYYVLLECLAQDHISFLATMEPQVFLYILSSISEGLTALGANLDYFTGRSLLAQTPQPVSLDGDRTVDLWISKHKRKACPSQN
jgi:hypothetical protein